MVAYDDETSVWGDFGQELFTNPDLKLPTVITNIIQFCGRYNMS